MSNDINTATFTGRLVRNAELKYTQGGTAVCEFSIASNYSRKQGDGWTEEVSYFDCSMFGKRADALAKYLTKGQQVAIQASPRQERWEKDGQKRSRVRFIVDQITLVGGRSDGGNQGATAQPSSATPSSSDFDDDVPF